MKNTAEKIWHTEIIDSARTKDGDRQLFISGIWDAHTKGLRSTYQHPEFQIVLRIDPDIIQHIFFCLSDAIERGARYRAGSTINGILTGIPLRIIKAKDIAGETVFRIILPDDNGHWPEDWECNSYFRLQTLPLEMLTNVRRYPPS